MTEPSFSEERLVARTTYRTEANVFLLVWTSVGEIMIRKDKRLSELFYDHDLFVVRGHLVVGQNVLPLLRNFPKVQNVHQK